VAKGWRGVGVQRCGLESAAVQRREGETEHGLVSAEKRRGVGREREEKARRGGGREREPKGSGKRMREGRE
jgi:hypothetical protein